MSRASGACSPDGVPGIFSREGTKVQEKDRVPRCCGRRAQAPRTTTESDQSRVSNVGFFRLYVLAPFFIDQEPIMTDDPFDPDPEPGPEPEPAPPRPQVPSAAALPAIPFEPVPVRPRRDGWTAAKQRRFIEVLAETGIVRIAAAAVGMSERSVNRLALRDDAESFCMAMDAALQMAARRGASILFEYAFEGVPETVWRDGEIAYQRRRPSEKALFFLLSRLDPKRFGKPDPRYPDFDPVKANIADLSLHLDSLEDLPDEEGDEGEEEGPGGG